MLAQCVCWTCCQWWHYATERVMAMVRFLHLADLHLGWEPKYLTGEKKRDRRQRRDQTLKKAVDFALEAKNDIQGVLIVGDLFEKYCPEKVLVDEVIRQLERLTSAGLFLVTVPGNHDEMTYNNSVYREDGERWPGFLVTNPMPERVVTQRIKGVPVHVYSLAYIGGLTNAAKIDEFPREEDEGLHIACFHGSLDWEGVPDRSLPLSSKKLEKARYHYIALGHYHMALDKRIGSGQCVYPGAIEFKSFNDQGVGMLTVAEVGEHGVKLEKHLIELQPYEEKSLDLSDLGSLEALMALCKADENHDLIIKYHLTGVPRFHVAQEALEERLAPYFYYVEVVNEAHYFSDEFLEKIIDEPTIRGAFAKRMKEKAEGAVSDDEREIIEKALLEGLAVIEGRGTSHG